LLRLNGFATAERFRYTWQTLVTPE